jgi:transient receptor potential cation channel subfamily V protein 5
MAPFDMYRIVDDNNGGELVRLARKVFFSQQLRFVDNYLRACVSKLTRNDARGYRVPIYKIIQKEFSVLPGLSAIVARHKYASVKKHFCFDVKKRGRDGETLLHLCFLNGSAVHMFIARRVLALYPRTVNDIFIGDQYYGQSVLHMAIVNEDAPMVAFLLKIGAHVHQRCVGRFYLPDDQKRKAVLDYDECMQLPESTNYEGLSYFGEYPLSFAAVLDLDFGVDILLSYGADVNRQDSNGNTVFHMLVIKNNVVI